MYSKKEIREMHNNLMSCLKSKEDDADDNIREEIRKMIQSFDKYAEEEKVEEDE